MKRAIIVLVVLAAIGAGVGTYYYRRSGPEIAVNTAALSRGDIVDTVGSTGTLQAVTTVQVGSQVSGNIMELGADFNSIVKKGQVIAKLDPSLFQAQLEQSKASLNQAKANLAKAQSDLERMKVQLLDAQQKFNRSKELAAKSLVPQSDLDAAKIAVDSAQASLQSQMATVTQTEAAIAQSQASVNMNQVNVDHCIITAPIDGIITQRSVDVGQTVAASMQAPTLFVIAADLKKMQVSANIDESDVGRIRPQQRVTFRVDAYPTEQFVGTVIQIRLQPVVQSNVTTYGTIISVPNDDLKLKPGMTANLKVEVSRKNDAVRVPNAAIRFRPTPEMFAALNQPVPPEAQFGGRGGRGGRGAGGAGGGGNRANGGNGGNRPNAGGQNAQAGASATPAAAPPPTRGGDTQAAPPAAGGQADDGGGARGNRRGRGGQSADGAAAGGTAPGGDNSGGGGGSQGGDGQGGGRRGGGGGFGGGGGGGRGQALERFKSMTPEQQQQFIARMKDRGQDVSQFEAAMTKPAAAGRGGAGRGGQQQAGLQPKYGEAPTGETIDALFAPLPPVESQGRVWLYQEKQLKAVNVRLGITDGTFTELLSTDALQPGAEVVTTITGVGAVRPAANAQGTGNPFQQNQQRGGGPGGFGGGPPARGR
jgi:HlyD family secretion protein